MEEAFKDRVAPERWMWCVINNLEKFNDRPEYILELIRKYNQLKDHPSLAHFSNVLNAIERAWKQDSKFPDMEKLKIDFRDIRSIQITNDKFSMQIYDALIKHIEQEVLRQKVVEKFINQDNPDTEDLRKLSDEMNRFANRATKIPKETRESLVNLYEEYSAHFDGVKTYIQPVDDVIGVLGYQSLSVFAAPSGHGKSTFAMSVAYYNALSGKCVEYCSFEIPQNQMWFNIMSMDSEGTDNPVQSYKIKGSELSPEEAIGFKNRMNNFLDRMESCGGGLYILDQTTAGINTYEGFCSTLEARAEERGRKADLIIVDNIDNFQMFRSYERDEIAKINNYIIGLDGFVKQYCDGAGTSMLLLSQVNRPAMKKLYTAANDDSKSTKIDVTCVQKYNALYEKPTCVMIGYADEAARGSGFMRIHPVKLRNRQVPEIPIKVKVNYAYSKVLGSFEADKYKSQKDYEDNAKGCFGAQYDETTTNDINNILQED